MKTKDIPHDFRAFYTHFKSLEYKYDYITIFDDFLSAMMNYFTPPHSKGIDVSIFNKYTEQERINIGAMIPEIINLFHQKIEVEDLEWFDVFGAFYEALSSRSKKSRLGQFFTPEPLVEFMTSIQGEKEELIGKGMTVNDPACGSGRFLIAFHAKFPGNYTYAEDIDPISCKMACINMMLHGCEGEVIQHNALDPDDYANGWSINSMIRQTGLPSIVSIEKEQSRVYQMWQQKKEQIQQEKTTSAQKAEAEEIRIVGKQMDIFDDWGLGD